jgi:putative heme-binding domain-containing protein
MAQVMHETLPPATAADIEQGRTLFTGQCAGCHGQDGRGDRGANLVRPKLSYAVNDRMLYRAIRRGIIGTEMPGFGQMSDREIWQVAWYVKKLGEQPPEKIPGDAARGKQTYAKAGCAGCHMIAGAGGRLGPDLTEIGNKRSAAHLLKSVTEPAANIGDGFAYLRVEGADGKTVTGVRMNEDTFTLHLMDSSEKIHSFWKKDLRRISVEPAKTPMPGYQATLKQNELEDLVAYLASLRGER